MRLRIGLPENRDYAGWLEVVDDNGAVVLGPVPAAGRAHEQPASAHGNASRNPLQPFGDTPLGAYVVGGVLETGPGTGLDGEIYGAGGVVLLEPVLGPAALADAHGRFRLFIQGGAGDERLHTTAGAVRLFDRDLSRLVALMRRAEKRAPCDIITTQTLGETVDFAHAPRDADPPPLPDRSRLSTAPPRPAAKLGARTPLVAAGSLAARPAKRFFVAPERSGSSDGSTSYGGGSTGAAAPGDGGASDTGVGPLPASGVDVAPLPGADLNPPPDQSNVTLAETGADPLLSPSQPTNPSNSDSPIGWLPEAPLGSPYAPGIANLSDPLAPYLGANSGVYAPATPGSDANSFLASPAAYPYFPTPQDNGFGYPKGIDTSAYQAQAGNGFAAPPPPAISDEAFAAAMLGSQNGSAPPGSQVVDSTTLAGAPQVGTLTDPNGNPIAAQYQVNLGGTVYNAYLNDMKYPGQALLVPISQLDPNYSLADDGLFLSPAGSAPAASRSSGPAAPASPIRPPAGGPTPTAPFSPLRNTALPSGLPPAGASNIANALAEQFPLGGLPQAPPLEPPVPMPWGTPAEGPVARLYYPGALTLPPNFPAYDLVKANDYTENLTYERGASGATQGQPITVVNQTFEGGHWISVKTSTSANAMNELNRALENMYYKSGPVFRDSDPVDPDLPTTFLRVQAANPDSATIHILIPEAEAGNVPALQAAAEARVAAFDLGPPEPYHPGLPPEVNVRVTAWPGTDLANPNPPGPPEVGFGTKLATSGVYGAGVGAGVATVFQVGQMAWSSQQYSAGDYASATWRAATAGGVSGLAAAGLETAFTQQVSQQFAQSIFGGVARSAFGSGPAAGIFQAAQMATSGQSYTAQDYGAKVGTAAIEGVLSGALSAGLVGALGGSVAPGIGTAIGFGVSFAAFFLINYDFGEDIEGGLRGLMK